MADKAAMISSTWLTKEQKSVKHGRQKSNHQLHTADKATIISYTMQTKQE
jgi:hypothetical protein